MESVNIVWIGLILLFFMGMTYFIYQRFLKVESKQFVPNDEYIQENKKYECILFYTTWCPHCKKTLEDFNKYKTSNLNDQILYTLVDCDKKPDQADYYQIDSYPTIIMVVNGKNYIFDSNFSKDSMDKFVNMILNL
jgi:thiol-disulfide isomerase/thioredoxin